MLIKLIFALFKIGIISITAFFKMNPTSLAVYKKQKLQIYNGEIIFDK